MLRDIIHLYANMFGYLKTTKYLIYQLNTLFLGTLKITFTQNLFIEKYNLSIPTLLNIMKEKK